MMKSGSVWFSLADRVSPTSLSGLFCIFFWMRGSSSLLDRWVFFALASRFRELRHLVHSFNKKPVQGWAIKDKNLVSIYSETHCGSTFISELRVTALHFLFRFFLQEEERFKKNNLAKNKCCCKKSTIQGGPPKRHFFITNIFVADISFFAIFTVVHQKYAKNSNEFSHKILTTEKVSKMIYFISSNFKFL